MGRCVLDGRCGWRESLLLRLRLELRLCLWLWLGLLSVLLLELCELLLAEVGQDLGIMLLLLVQSKEC